MRGIGSWASPGNYNVTIESPAVYSDRVFVIMILFPLAL